MLQKDPSTDECPPARSASPWPPRTRRRGAPPAASRRRPRTAFAPPATSRSPTCGWRRRSAAGSSRSTSKEGDRVEPGARRPGTLDTRDIELAIDRARAERRQAEAQLRLLRAGSRREDIRQAEAQAEAARDEHARGAGGTRSSAEPDLERFEPLLEKHAGSRKQRDDAATRRDVAKARLAGTAERVRAAQATRGPHRAGARREEIEAARGPRRDACRPQIATLEKTLGDTTLVSPVAGMVTEKLVEVGEVIAPRTPAVVITDLDHAWADVYVPEPAVPRITARPAGHGLHRRRRPGSAGHGHLHLAEGGVHAAQRADRRRARRSWSTACASPWTTRTASSSRACRSKPIVPLQAPP